MEASPYSSTEMLLSNMPDDIRPDFERVLALPTERRELVDLIMSQDSINVAIMKALVTVVSGDRMATNRALNTVVEMLQKSSQRSSSALSRLLTPELYDTLVENPE